MYVHVIAAIYVCACVHVRIHTYIPRGVDPEALKALAPLPPHPSPLPFSGSRNGQSLPYRGWTIIILIIIIIIMVRIYSIIIRIIIMYVRSSQ